MAVTTTQVGNLQQDLILSIVQEHLVRSGALVPTVRDYSQSVAEGTKSIEIPKLVTTFNAPAAQNPDGVTLTAEQTAAFDVDQLALDKWVTLPFSISDRISAQTRIDVLSQYAELAGKRFAQYIDDSIIVELRKASTTSPDHVFQVTGASSTLALADIITARQLLNQANVPMSDRFLLVSPRREAELHRIANIQKANEYGSRESLLNGEIGQLYGFRVITNNGVAADEAIAYHREAVGVAFQKGLSFESQRARPGRQAMEYAFSAGWGVKVLNDGKMQVLMED